MTKFSILSHHPMGLCSLSCTSDFTDKTNYFLTAHKICLGAQLKMQILVTCSAKRAAQQLPGKAQSQIYPELPSTHLELVSDYFFKLKPQIRNSYVEIYFIYTPYFMDYMFQKYFESLLLKCIFHHLLIQKARDVFNTPNAILQALRENFFYT